MITSAQNPKIQLLRTLFNRRKDRQAAGQFIAEGVRLVEEAWQAGLLPEILFYSKDLSPRGLQIVENYRSQKGVDAEEILPSLMDSLTQTENSQGLLAVFPMQSRPLPARLNFVIIADNLRDPGNLGPFYAAPRLPVRTRFSSPQAPQTPLPPRCCAPEWAPIFACPCSK